MYFFLNIILVYFQHANGKCISPKPSYIEIRFKSVLNVGTIWRKAAVEPTHSQPHQSLIIEGDPRLLKPNRVLARSSCLFNYNWCIRS